MAKTGQWAHNFEAPKFERAVTKPPPLPPFLPAMFASLWSHRDIFPSLEDSWTEDDSFPRTPLLWNRPAWTANCKRTRLDDDYDYEVWQEASPTWFKRRRLSAHPSIRIGQEDPEETTFLVDPSRRLGLPTWRVPSFFRSIGTSLGEEEMDDDDDDDESVTLPTTLLLLDRPFWTPTHKRNRTENDRGKGSGESWSRSKRQRLDHNLVEWQEDEGQVTLSLDVPGVQAKDLHVWMEEGTLRIRGSRKTSKDSSHQIQRELDYAFSMDHHYPRFDLDQLTASLQDGVLSVKVPRKNKEESPTGPRKISIQVTDHKEDASLPSSTSPQSSNPKQAPQDAAVPAPAEDAPPKRPRANAMVEEASTAPSTGGA